MAISEHMQPVAVPIESEKHQQTVDLSSKSTMVQQQQLKHQNQPCHKQQARHGNQDMEQPVVLELNLSAHRLAAGAAPDFLIDLGFPKQNVDNPQCTFSC